MVLQESILDSTTQAEEEEESSRSSSEEESTEQDPTGNLGERFRLLVRQVLRKAPLLFSSRMREISCETQKVPPVAITTEPHEISNPNTSL